MPPRVRYTTVFVQVDSAVVPRFRRRRRGPGRQSPLHFCLSLLERNLELSPVGQKPFLPLGGQGVREER